MQSWFNSLNLKSFISKSITISIKARNCKRKCAIKFVFHLDRPDARSGVRYSARGLVIDPSGPDARLGAWRSPRVLMLGSGPMYSTPIIRLRAYLKNIEVSSEMNCYASDVAIYESWSENLFYFYCDLVSSPFVCGFSQRLIVVFQQTLMWTCE